MARTATQYLHQLQALLPQGAAWTREPGTILASLLDALAQEPARVDARGDALVRESDPRTTQEMIADWERAFGLPVPCTWLASSLNLRRSALHANVISTGGQSRAYYIGVAAALGYTITITEFRPFTVGDHVDDPIYGEDWAYAWQVNAPAETVTYFSATSGAGDALAEWGNARLECAISRIKPAHTIVIFSYA